MAPVRRFYEEVGRRLRRARTEAGLTQQQLAAAVDLSRASVANIEAGRQPFPVYTLALFARALELPIGALVPNSDVLEPSSPVPEAAIEGLDEQSKNWVRKILTPPEEAVG